MESLAAILSLLISLLGCSPTFELRIETSVSFVYCVTGGRSGMVGIG